MKKSIIVVLSIILAVSLCGCAGRLKQEDTSGQTENTTTATQTNGEVGLVADTTEAGTADTEDQCAHIWGQWEEKTVATCQVTGVRERECQNCSETQIQKIEKTSHKESDWVIETFAKVGVAGRKYTKCAYCDKRLKEETIPAFSESHQHAIAQWITVTNPSCTTGGKQNGVCLCGKTMETKTLSETGHTPVVDKAVAPTCTANGLTEGSHCSVCSAILVAQTRVNAKGHNISSKIVAATANKNEHILYYCTNCNYSYEETATPSSVLQFKSNNDGTCSVTGINDTTLENVVVPQKSPAGDTVVAIYERAFKSNKTLKSISLPSTVNKIGEFAFYECSNLTSVTGSQYVNTIGVKAFSNCSSLTELDLSSATAMDNYICSGATSLSVVKLSNKIKKLPQGMFSDCTALLDIELPSGITVIGNSAFASSNIENIVLPDSVEEIEMYAFRYCRNLKNIKLSQNLKIINASVFDQCISLSNIVLPDRLETLGRLAFMGCESLTNIHIPSTVTLIGDSCFWGCTELKTVSLPNGIKSIPAGLFDGCTALKEVTLPSSITLISQESFSGTGLTKIVIPDACTEIANSAFSGCKNLAVVSFGVNLKKIGAYAFRGCKSLVAISLPNDFKSIEDRAFLNCTGLQKVYLGTAITNIGNGAFKNCTSLTSIFLPKSLSEIKMETNDEVPFTGCSGELDIYSDAPQSIYNWSWYFGQVSYGVSYDEYLKIIQ